MTTRPFFLLFTLSFAMALGCNKNQPKPAPVLKGGQQPEKVVLPDDPLSKEVRTVAGGILDRLLANKLTESESSLQQRANAVQGFQSWSIQSQRQEGEDRATLDGYLTGAAAKARFSMLLVKQQNGNWAVGTFSGPNPVE